ncbi:hypothetical protein [Wenjunlia tyrosinilytica]|uniref:Uncharacterized protein n=1 Tax=Wenjunlia tyrosinilytica TaxID=1544741 RepID=A0A918E126_9ACTN|nr:hypothetical protein [Wenjunlia tyrosinilytica]GGO96410.1 hypothetical protein GCM10012280_55830 [Wenjunlia tyrosinilytica]
MRGLDGRWVLVGAGVVRPAVAYELRAEEESLDAVIAGTRMPLDDMVRRWLAGEVLGAEAVLVPASGLVLEVARDAAFRESGTAQVEWFSGEGVLESAAEPFGGRIVSTPAGHHLVLSEPVAWAQPYSAEDGDVRLRLDDGDTRIADTVHLLGDRLRRTVSVVTDEMYLDRLVYDYARG